MKTPISLYHPTKTRTKRGAFSETLGDATTIWGTPNIHQESLSVNNIAVGESIGAGDIFKIQAKQYRVTSVQEIPGTMTQVAYIEKVNQPISD